MRLGFDLDGTVADLQRSLAREARDLFPGIDPRSLPRSAAADVADDGARGEGKDGARTEAQISARTLSGRQQRELWKIVRARTNFWETLDEIEPGVLARLHRLSHDQRWEVIFLTSRPETAGDTAQAQSHRWLEAHGYASPSVFVVHGSRGKIASALHLDVFVDDRPENCLDIAIDSTARAILVWRDDEDKVPGSARQLGIGAVRSVSECLDILEALDQETQKDQASMIHRLKRLLGLRPRAARLQDPSRPPAVGQT